MYSGQSAHSHAGDAEDAVQRNWRRDNRTVFGFPGILFIAVEFIVKISHAVAPVGNRLLGHHIVGRPDIFTFKI